MVASPAVSWLFFKARAKRPYLSHTGPASNAEKQPTGPGPEGGVEMGRRLRCSSLTYRLRYAPLVPIPLGPPRRRPILNATTSPLFARRYTSERILLSATFPR